VGEDEGWPHLRALSFRLALASSKDGSFSRGALLSPDNGSPGCSHLGSTWSRVAANKLCQRELLHLRAGRIRRKDGRDGKKERRGGQERLFRATRAVSASRPLIATAGIGTNDFFRWHLKAAREREKEREREATNAVTFTGRDTVTRAASAFYRVGRTDVGTVRKRRRKANKA